MQALHQSIGQPTYTMANGVVYQINLFQFPPPISSHLHFPRHPNMSPRLAFSHDRRFLVAFVQKGMSPSSSAKCAPWPLYGFERPNALLHPSFKLPSE